MAEQGGRLDIGSRIQVRNRYLSEFRPGFEVAAFTGGGYFVRRISDGEQLPVAFGVEEVRPDPGLGQGR